MPEPSDSPIFDALRAETTHPRYVYTDPVADERWPRITEPNDDDVPDAFPEGWGSAPTERDQAAIAAGNA